MSPNLSAFGATPRRHKLYPGFAASMQVGAGYFAGINAKHFSLFVISWGWLSHILDSPFPGGQFSLQVIIHM